MGARGWGRIINTVSGAGLDPQHPGAAAYATAKAAVYGFTRAAALEAPLGVTVNAVSPLAITRMSEAYFARAEPGARERLDPAHAARAVVWLASDDAAAVNGRTFRVEGPDLIEVL
jgi:NAD(P)-dependent dehydrogenase (short-subunit alcohol dehydrogenase family)